MSIEATEIDRVNPETYIVINSFRTGRSRKKLRHANVTSLPSNSLVIGALPLLNIIFVNYLFVHLQNANFCRCIPQH